MVTTDITDIKTESKSSKKERLAKELIDTWQKDPLVYVDTMLNVQSIWKLQKDLLDACPRAIKQHKHIYVGSGHSLGKDYICGGIALWFLSSYKPSIVIETAPTDRQVKKIMYSETMNHWKKRDPFIQGTAFVNPYIEIEKNSWYLIGFTTKETGASKDGGGGKFQGFHCPNICVIVSEAQAVEDNIYDQIDGITTSENVLVIFIGNPTRAKGRFAKGLKNTTDNIVFNFSCLDNPNYIQKRTVIPGLCSYEWVEDKRKKWGEEDPRWFGRVLGQVPKTSINNVFSDSIINKVKGKETISTKVKAGASIDVAGEGDDENVLYAGQNGMVQKEEIQTNQAPGTNALHVLGLCQAVGGNFIVVDCDGVGIGVKQELDKLEHKGIDIIKFHGAGSADERPGIKQEYQNLRAKAWFTAKQRCINGTASIPDDALLIEELLEVCFFENNRGLIQLEDKVDVKERLGRSPDRADAWVMFQWALEEAKFVKDVKDVGDSGSILVDRNDTLRDKSSRSFMIA